MSRAVRKVSLDRLAKRGEVKFYPRRASKRNNQRPFRTFKLDKPIRLAATSKSKR